MSVSRTVIAENDVAGAAPDHRINIGVRYCAAGELYGTVFVTPQNRLFGQRQIGRCNMPGAPKGDGVLARGKGPEWFTLTRGLQNLDSARQIGLVAGGQQRAAKGQLYQRAGRAAGKGGFESGGGIAGRANANRMSPWNS